LCIFNVAFQHKHSFPALLAGLRRHVQDLRAITSSAPQKHPCVEVLGKDLAVKFEAPSGKQSAKKVVYVASQKALKRLSSKRTKWQCKRCKCQREFGVLFCGACGMFRPWDDNGQSFHLLNMDLLYIALHLTFLILTLLYMCCP